MFQSLKKLTHTLTEASVETTFAIRALNKTEKKRLYGRQWQPRCVVMAILILVGKRRTNYPPNPDKI